MIDKALTREGRMRRRRNRERLLAASCTLMIGAALFGRLSLPSAPDEAAAPQAAPSERLRLAAAPAEDRGWLFDPAPVLGSGVATLRLSRAAPASSELADTLAEDRLADDRIADDRLAGQREESALQTLAAVTEPVLITVPLPLRRPDGLTPGPRETVRLAQRSQTSRVASVGRVDAQAEQSFFETVFGANKPEAPALAYAPLDSGAVESGPRRLTGPSVRAEGNTAVYNILARTVTLPSGERLEAHSGLGPAMDNPNFVHLRMRGSTPPGTYDLTERERLFHGVRAIRCCCRC